MVRGEKIDVRDEKIDVRGEQEWFAKGK